MNHATEPLTLSLPSDAVVILIGAAGSGKSTFVARHFPADSIVSADRIRADLGGQGAGQERNEDVFARVHQLVEERAAAGLLTVIDATNTRGPGRAELGWHAHRQRRPLVAIALHLPLQICLDQNARRPRPVPADVVRRQVADLRHLETDLETEGYAAVTVCRSRADIDNFRVSFGSS
ncbi:MAG: AAA family ATPase [Candidatus Dormibacteraeota bacterium]|nr:AAA family ATPase [Candidatus Dormibacteraeota bacterium]